MICTGFQSMWSTCMQNIAGPHHAHPQGDIDLIMLQDDTAQFDCLPAGWSARQAARTDLRALNFYHHRSAVQASTAVLGHLQTPAA